MGGMELIEIASSEWVLVSPLKYRDRGMGNTSWSAKLITQGTLNCGRINEPLFFSLWKGLKMMNYLVIVITLMLSGFSWAAEGDDIKKIVAIQQARLESLEVKLKETSAKLDKYISDQGLWQGQNSGLIGPMGVPGPEGRQGAPGPSNLHNIVIEENNSCNTYCNYRGWVCLFTTQANWENGSQDRCASVIAGRKRCLCAG